MTDFIDSVPTGFAEYVGDNIDWMTASEIAELRLPNMPASERGVLKRAKTENWRGRRRRAQGGGTEYSIGNLPDECAMIILRGRHRSPRKAIDVRPECGAARIRILDAINEVAAKIGYKQACLLFVELSKARNLPPALALDIKRATPMAGNRSRLSYSTLRRWMRTRKNHGDAALTPKSTSPRVEPDPEWLAPFMDAYRDEKRAIIPRVLDRLHASGVVTPQRSRVEAILSAKHLIGREETLPCS